MSSLLFDEDVVRRNEGSRLKLGLILENYDNTSDEENESADDSDDDELKGKKGHVLVAWYPKGRTEVVPRDQVQLHDRSLMAGDLVQRSSSSSSSGQLGTVKAVRVTCNLQVHSTRQIIYDIPSRRIQPITWIYPGTFVSLDSWVGEVEDTTTEIVVVMKNGARCALSEMAAGKLTDIHDYSVEDSVFGESDGFFPGQTLWGRSNIFKSARWLSGQQPVMSGRSNFQVVVEGVYLKKLDINWQTRGLTDTDTAVNDEGEAPSSAVTGEDIKRVKPLQFFSADRVQVGDKGMYQVCKGDVVSAKAVPKGSPMSFKKSGDVQSKKIVTMGLPEAEGGKQLKCTPGGTSKETGNYGRNKGVEREERSGMDLSGSAVANEEVPASDDLKVQNQDMADKSELAASSGVFIESCEQVVDKSERKEVSGTSDKAGVCKPGTVEEVVLPNEDGSDPASGDIPSGATPVETGITIQHNSGDAAGLSREGAEETTDKPDVSTSGEEHHLKALFNLSVQFVQEYKNLVDMAQDFKTYFPEASDAVGNVERRVRGFTKTHNRMQEQIAQTRHLLDDSLGSDNRGKVPETTIKECSSDSEGEEGCDSDASSQSSSGGDRRPKRVGSDTRRRKRHNGTKTNKDPVKLGDCVCVEVTHTHTAVDVEWQDGSMDSDIEASSLTPVDLLEDMHFFPGDFVTKCIESEENSYGVVRSLDYKERTCQICWISKPNQQSKIPQVVNTEELSIYDLIPHPDFHISTGETVVRIAYTSLPEGEQPTNDQPVAGQILSVTPEGMVNVTWVDGSQSAVYPQEIYVLEGDGSESSGEEEDEIDSEDERESSQSSETGSWETATEKSENDEDDEEETRGKKGKSARESDSGDSVKDRGVGATAREDGELKVSGIRISDDGDTGTGDMKANSGNVSNDLGKDNSASNTGGEGKDVTRNGDIGVTRNGDMGNDLQAENGPHGLKEIEKKGQVEEELNVTSQNGTDVVCDKCGEKMSPSPAIMKDATTSTDEDLEDSVLTTGTGAVRRIPKEKVEEAAGISGIKPSLKMNGDMEEKSLGGVFSLIEVTPECHHFYSASVQPADQKKFLTALRKEVQLLRSSLPPGIWLKGFEDKMYLFSALIEGPANTPYEDCLFYFDGYLPDNYPRKPPVVHFHAFCPGKLNPNLYNEGRICLSLLDTWTGKGSEVWTKKSSLLQLLVSIQGLILNSEPYFNEAGYEKHRGSPHGIENSRMYNETALIKVVQSVTNLIIHPPEIFREETLSFYTDHADRLISRVERWLDQISEEGSSTEELPDVGFPLLPLSRGFVLSARQVVTNLKSRWAEVSASLATS